MAKSSDQTLRNRLHEVIFEAETPAGKAFDIGLLIAIVLSIVVVSLETIPSGQMRWGSLLRNLEWVLTIAFTVEYLLRLYCVRKPLKYATSFFGIIDLIAIVPTYLSLFFTGTNYMMVIRALRLLRVFRILKLGHFMVEGRVIVQALEASKAKIIVFLTFISLMVVIIGSLMYLVEGGANPNFSSIPMSMYWTVVTLTTVGYGDIYPITPLGKFLSVIIMIMGYGVLAVPTGIVSVEMARSSGLSKANTVSCPECSQEGHDADAVHCKFCGAKL